MLFLNSYNLLILSLIVNILFFESLFLIFQRISEWYSYIK